MKTWRLRTSLSLLLAVTTALTFLVIGSAILVLRVPQINAEATRAVQSDARDKARLLEFYLAGLEAQLKPLAMLAAGTPPRTLTTILAATVADGRQFLGAYLVDRDGIVRAAVLPPQRQQSRSSLLGADLSRTPLFRSLAGRDSAWSDKHLSASSGEVVVGVAVRSGEWTVIGEVIPGLLRETVNALAGNSRDMLLVVDASGEWIADSSGGGERKENLGALPTVQAAFARIGDGQIVADGGEQRFVGSARPQNLGWTFIVTRPAGFANAELRRVVLLIGAAFAAALLIGLLLAIGWARRLARPVQQLIARTRLLADGAYEQAAKARRASNIAELQELDSNLQTMADAIGEREASLRHSEKELETIFNASPVAISVSDTRAGYRALKVNEAWVRQFGHTAADAVGKTGDELGLWVTAEDRELFVARFRYGPGVYDDLEFWLKHADGHLLLCRVSARVIEVAGQRLLVMVSDDITEARRMAAELRHINEELEVRVEQRTAQLSEANSELAGALDHLQRAQDELVRTEKLAALGRLVAGVAHELNTPLGNGLMAVSTLAAHLDAFRGELASGLRRSALEGFVASVDTASGIALRNLERAAELIASFKQVAVDQSSSQRRRFPLRQAVNELLTAMRPTLARSGHQVVADIPATIELDSYPGPLEQTLGNLIDNALRHAFDGRRGGRVTIAGEAVDEERIRLVVADDGCGIAEEHLARIFDPFFTTRLGQGGSGLGLHIVHNIVDGILGGHIEVASSAGAGTRFTLLLPIRAPANEAAGG
ncbi:MAG TPA: ATP-binding protein [Azospira sp.]|nr:ATP-binding protein [Azospira sp.]